MATLGIGTAVDDINKQSSSTSSSSSSSAATGQTSSTKSNNNKAPGAKVSKCVDDTQVSNGNGLEDDPSKLFNRTPGGGGDLDAHHHDLSMMKSSVQNDMMHKFKMDSMNQLPHPSSFESAFDVGIGDHGFNDYPLMPPIDSPGMGMDGYSQMYQQRGPGQNPSGMMPHHQGQAFGPQNPGPGQGPQNAFPQNPYYQDPFAQMGHMIPTGPQMLPQYYGMNPWGMYGAPMNGPMNQQQVMMARAASSGRPMSPSASDGSGSGVSSNGTGAPGGTGQAPPGHNPGYPPQMMPPYFAGDQNGSMMMGAAARAAAMGGMNPAAAMRMMPPMMHMNQRMMMSQNGFSSNSNGYNSGSGSSVYSNPSSSLGNGGFGQMNHNGYGSLGPIGGSLNSSGAGNSSPRRDSIDRRDSFSSIGFGSDSFLRKNNQSFDPYFGSMSSPGPFGMVGGQSPPPNGLNGSFGSTGLGPSLGRGGSLSAAPGENKWVNGMRNGHMSSPFGSMNLGSGHGHMGTGPSASGFGGHHVGGGHSRGPQRNSIDKSTGRSRLLEDFRNSRYPNLQLRDLTDHIVEFSQDQHGSRFIQQKLERATPAEKQLVFNEIIGSAYSLMTDVFGNYVIQKFFEFGSPEQKQNLAMKVKGHVLPLALQMYGCRVIQKALESIPPEQQKEIVRELDGHVLKCVKDQNGNHVVQKCIECVDPHALQFIIDSFRGQVLQLSTHPYGCRVIQRILEHCTPEQTAPILEELHSQTEQLVQDQYGNYVIQHVLEHGRPEDKSKLINCVRGKVLVLSQHKFAR